MNAVANLLYRAGKALEALLFRVLYHVSPAFREMWHAETWRRYEQEQARPIKAYAMEKMRRDSLSLAQLIQEGWTTPEQLRLINELQNIILQQAWTIFAAGQEIRLEAEDASIVRVGMLTRFNLRHREGTEELFVFLTRAIVKQVISNLKDDGDPCQASLVLNSDTLAMMRMLRAFLRHRLGPYSEVDYLEI